MQTAAQKNRS